MPSGRINLFLVDAVFTARHGVRHRNDIHARTRADRVVTVRIDLQIFGYILQLAQRHVHADDGHYLARCVLHRARTTHHVGLRTRVIQVRLAPPTTVVRKPVLEPLHAGVVMLRTAYLTRVDTVLGDTTAAGLEIRALFREITRNKRHRHTGVRAQRAHRQTRRREDGIGCVQVLLR